MTKINKWNNWIENIKCEVSRLVSKRNIFLEIKKIIDCNENLHRPSAFYNFIDTIYASYGVMGVRRQVFHHRDSISLKGLLLDIKANPKEINLEKFCSHYKGSVAERFAPKDFRMFSTEDNTHVDPNKVQKDIEELDEIYVPIKAFADKRVAHRDLVEELDHIPSFDELNCSIEVVRKVASKYVLLLQAKSNNLSPTITDHWKEIFMYPWIERKQ